MATLSILFALSLATSILLTPAIRGLAGRCGLLDKPDQRRKLHKQATPVAGGIAILLATLISITVLLLSGQMPWTEEFRRQGDQLLGLAIAAIVISGVGVLDDWGRLRGRHKLLGQVLAISILIGSGLLVKNLRLFHWELDLGLLAIPFTAFFLLGAINSLNLLDGMDGLLSTVGLIVTLAFTGMAVLGDKWPTACVAVAMAGALLGFLRYNFPPASIYLGDTGSMLIGLVIGALAIQSALKGPATVALAAPVAVLFIPILDTAAAIFRRKLTGRSIYTTDRGHLHHCLLRHGFSKIGVLMFVSLSCLVVVMGALLSIAFNSEWLAILAAVTVAVLLIGMRWFGDVEAQLVTDRLKSLALSLIKFRKAEQPRQSAVRLQGNGAWAEVWSGFTQSAIHMNLNLIRLDINAPLLHESYHASWINPAQEDNEAGVSHWSVTIPLVLADHTVGRLEVNGFPDDQPVWMKIAALSKMVEEVELALGKIAESAGVFSAPPATVPAVLPVRTRLQLLNLDLTK